MTTRTIRLAALLLAASASAHAATYYVATTGSDSAAGTAAAPFKTIAKGVAAAKAGDTILVRAGSYPHTGSSGAMSVTINKAGSSGAPITLKSETKWGAILDGKSAHSYLSFGGSSAYWVIDGFDIRGGQNAAIFANSGGAKNIKIINNHIHHVGNRANETSIGEMGVYTDTAASGEISGNTINDVGRTTHITGNHDHGVYTHGKMNIINNVFYNMYNGWHIQTAAGYSGTIAYNTFVGAATVNKPGSIMIWGSTGNLIVRNNIFYGPLTYAISTLNSPVSGTCSITNNVVYTPSKSVAVIETPVPSGCAVSNNKLNVNPTLVNPAFGGDYHLKAGSPAIDAGVAISGISSDVEGKTRPSGSAPDIGAYEYGASGGGGTPGGGTTTPVPVGDTTAPVISALAVTGLTSGAATVAWTTSEPATGQVEYGPSAALGQQSPLIGTMTTAHSVGLSGLTPGTVYYYRAKSKDAAGNTATSAAGNFTASGGGTVTPPAGCQASGSTWKNIAFSPQTGGFTVEFDGVPSGAAIDAVTGLSNGPASGYGGLATIVRFNNAGRIDARNGGAYAAASAVPYQAGQNYHFRMVVDVPKKTYTTYVRQGSGTEQLLGQNYAFRTEQAGATSLSSLGLASGTGSHNVCNFKTSAGGVSPTPAPPTSTPTPTPIPGCAAVGAAWNNQGFTARTANFTVTWDATPGAPNIDGVMGVSDGAATDYPKLAAAVRFNTTGRIDARNGGGYAAAAAIPYSSGVAHTFRLVVDPTAKRYTAYVKPAGGSEKLIGSNFSFRTEQAGVSRLSNLGSAASTGSLSVCAPAVTP